MTHGSTYLLEYAPNSIRALMGLPPPRERVTILDSALVYEDVVNPIFNANCNMCHNEDKGKGKLLLIDPRGIMEGGESGLIIKPGDPAGSELFHRISLDPNHDDFMPAEGRSPLTREEIALLGWWIEEGASFDKKVIDLALTERIKGYLKEVGIGMEDSFLAGLKIPAIMSEVYDSIVIAGFDIKTITKNSTLLEASYSLYNPGELNEEKLRMLMNAHENITWLKLSGSSLRDEWLAYIGLFTNLSKLWINETMITDKGITHLESLKNLEYLNVYGTQITNHAIESIVQMTSLKKLYIWQTDITDVGVARISDSLPELQVIKGDSSFRY